MTQTMERVIVAVVLACAVSAAPSAWGAEPSAAAAAPSEATEAKEPAMVIADNTTVTLEYTLTVDGEVVDTTKDREPFIYQHGKGQIIPGLERQLVGLSVGQTQSITVGPEEGYGPVRPDAVIEITKAQLPENMEPQVGMVLGGRDPSGQPVRARIVEVGKENVKVDLNHPLAGKTLKFDVTVKQVQPAAAGS